MSVRNVHFYIKHFHQIVLYRPVDTGGRGAMPPIIAKLIFGDVINAA